MLSVLDTVAYLDAHGVHLTKDVVYAMVRANTFPSAHAGRKILVPVAALERWIDGTWYPPQPPPIVAANGADGIANENGGEPAPNGGAPTPLYPDLPELDAPGVRYVPVLPMGWGGVGWPGAPRQPYSAGNTRRRVR